MVPFTAQLTQVLTKPPCHLHRKPFNLGLEVILAQASQPSCCYRLKPKLHPYHSVDAGEIKYWQFSDVLPIMPLLPPPQQKTDNIVLLTVALAKNAGAPQYKEPWDMPSETHWKVQKQWRHSNAGRVFSWGCSLPGWSIHRSEHVHQPSLGNCSV